jgi:hypothetical protein
MNHYSRITPVNRISSVKQIFSGITAFAFITLLLGPVTASAERTFKWVDAQGNTHYGDRVPIQVNAQQRREINEQGRTLKAYAEPGAKDAIAEQKRLAAVEYEKQLQTEEQSQQDKELLATYKAETDILVARDNELDAIKELIRMTEIRITSLQKRLADLTTEAADYEERGKPVPEFVAHQTTAIRDQIDQNQSIITLKQMEMQKINEKYTADILRYQALHNRKLSAR